jgi:MFS family permease
MDNFWYASRYGFEIDGQPVLPASWTSGFSSISSVGQFFGGLLCSLLSDRLGRRASLFIGLLFVCGGIFGEVFSHTRPAFLIGKLILGVGLGFYLTIAPLYTSELAPVAIRGIVTAGINFAIVIGQLLSNGAIAGFGTRTDDWAFRGPFAIQWVFVGEHLCLPVISTPRFFWPSVLDSHPSGRFAVGAGITVVLRPQRQLGSGA